ARDLLDARCGVLRPVGLEGLGLGGDQARQALGQGRELLDPSRGRGFFGGAHVAGAPGWSERPCSFSISRATGSARPMPPARVIDLAMASVRKDFHIDSPSPPPNGSEMF